MHVPSIWNKNGGLDGARRVSECQGAVRSFCFRISGVCAPFWEAGKHNQRGVLSFWCVFKFAVKIV